MKSIKVQPYPSLNDQEDVIDVIYPNGMNSSSKIDLSSQQKIDIIFQDIEYSVEVQKKSEGVSAPCCKQMEEKIILKNATGIFKAGQVSAIMGASGAGKTTLLNLIACRIDHAKHGKLLANETEYTYQNFGGFANYVMQNDVLLQTLTVLETLEFAANLKLNLSSEQKKEKIDKLVTSMKLQKCLNVVIGGVLIKGISGGERKRTSIAFELITDPQVIMLDEPTSGLDSLTSYIIVNHLSRLAHEQGKTVIMTIHQPNSEIYQLFDRLLLLVEGKIIYQGLASQATTYFSTRLNLAPKEFENPADYFMSIMHHESKENVERYPQYFEEYEKSMKERVKAEIREAHKNEIVERNVEVSISTSYGTLIKRDYLNTVRNPMLVKSRLFQTIFISVYIGGLYFSDGRQDYTNTTYWNSIVGFMFQMCISMLMSSLSPVSLVFPLERAVFLKEESSRLYTTLPYFISRNVVEIPYLIIFPFLTCIIMYWMIGFASTAQQFFTFYFIAFLISFAGNSLGLLIGSIILDAKSVSAAVPLFLLPFVLFSGLFKNRGNLPVWLGWFEYISPIKYGFLSFLQNETAYKSSNISYLNFDLETWTAIGILIGISVGFRFISLFFLWFLRTKIE